MANKKSLTRPARRQAASASASSIMSKVTLFAFVLLAIICFLPAGNLVRADDKAAEKEDYGTVIGIDLGTTYSCVA